MERRRVWRTARWSSSPPFPSLLFSLSLSLFLSRLIWWMNSGEHQLLMFLTHHKKSGGSNNDVWVFSRFGVDCVVCVWGEEVGVERSLHFCEEALPQGVLQRRYPDYVAGSFSPIRSFYRRRVGGRSEIEIADSYSSSPRFVSKFELRSKCCLEYFFDHSVGVPAVARRMRVRIPGVEIGRR